MDTLKILVIINILELHSVPNNNMRICDNNGYDFGHQTTNSDLITIDLVIESRFHCFINGEINNRMDQSYI